MIEIGYPVMFVISSRIAARNPWIADFLNLSLGILHPLQGFRMTFLIQQRPSNDSGQVKDIFVTVYYHIQR